jgi:hypothetical protein
VNEGWHQPFVGVDLQSEAIAYVEGGDPRVVFPGPLA